MSKYKHTDGKIKELEEEIKFLNKSLNYSAVQLSQLIS